MKNIKLILFSLIAVSIVGCSPYGYVGLNYPVKPVAYFPEKTSKIAIINRSAASSANSELSTAESIATGEIAGSDEKAAAKSITGVYDGIHGKSNITIATPSTKLYGTGTRKMPDPLDWETVVSICKSNNSDLLLSRSLRLQYRYSRKSGGRCCRDFKRWYSKNSNQYESEFIYIMEIV